MPFVSTSTTNANGKSASAGSNSERSGVQVWVWISGGPPSGLGIVSVPVTESASGSEVVGSTLPAAVHETASVPSADGVPAFLYGLGPAKVG